MSVRPRCSTIAPSATRTMSMPVTDTRRPVGCIPISAPVCVPVKVVATATRSPSATSSSISTVTSGKASRNIEKKSFTPSRPCGSPGGMLCDTKPSPKNESTTSGSRAASNSVWKRRTRSALTAANRTPRTPAVPMGGARRRWEPLPMKLAAALTSVMLAGLLSAGAADAATYCVKKPSCAGTDQPDPQTALTKAALSAQADRIEVGPGTFFSDKGFIYLGAGAGNTVELVGAGDDKTELEGGSSVTGRPALALQGSAPATVSNLTVTGDEPVNAAVTTGALRIFGSADHVVVDAEGSTNGVELMHDSTL